MELTPGLAGETFLEVSLDRFHCFSARQAPAAREAVDVRIHRESRIPECLVHDHAGSLVTYPGQGFQLLETGRDLPLVAVYKDSRSFHQASGLHFCKPAGGNKRLHLLPLQRGHAGGIGSKSKERRRHEIHPRICAAGRKHDRHQ